MYKPATHTTPGRKPAPLPRHGLLPWLLMLWWLATALPLHAEPAAVVAVTGPLQPLDTQIEVFEDPTGRHELGTVRRVPASQWQRPQSVPLNPGLSNSAWWLRVHLRNEHMDQHLHRWLELGSPRQDHVEALLVRGDGSVQRFPVTGDRHPFAQRPLVHRHPLFPLTLAPGETLTVYLRAGSHDGLHEPLPLTLWTQDAFTAHNGTGSLVYGLYFGGLLALIIYNLFLFASARMTGLGMYALYLGAVLSWSATFNGFSFQYLWPGHPDFNNQFLALAAAASFGTGAMFVVHYLPTRQLSPRCHTAMVWLAAANFATALPALLGIYRWTFVLIVPSGCATALASLCVGIRLMRLGNRSARYFVTSWLVMALGVMMYLLTLLTLLPASMSGDAVLLIQIGSAFEVLVLAFGLADSLNQSKAQALQAERQARVTQQTLALRLEEQVQERTLELERANVRLRELAITDELTGAFNRRHFNAALETEVSHMQRARDGLAALCLVDVDNFKAYNDLYGHQRGDEALKGVAAALQQHLRRGGDQLYRVGGEEFAFLLRTHDAAAALAHVDAMRQAILHLGLPHSGTAAQVVSASFGLVLWPPGMRDLPPGDIYKSADELLYDAKAAGRNRVLARTLEPGTAQVKPQSARLTERQSN